MRLLIAARQMLEFQSLQRNSASRRLELSSLSKASSSPRDLSPLFPRPDKSPDCGKKRRFLTPRGRIGQNKGPLITPSPRHLPRKNVPISAPKIITILFHSSFNGTKVSVHRDNSTQINKQ
ncbi:hypothetical protein AVEN_238308-1 [Araneus ventricosus]|uniref:Uncharacterized protein n=1 Tax=Araneus ventricosus TaxID=182803 RepID=A0A4Y2SER6_ARAVE|nr:hypothetical protein AVEN_238308-1 [Araneus ventricosus]